MLFITKSVAGLSNAKFASDLLQAPSRNLGWFHFYGGTSGGEFLSASSPFHDSSHVRSAGILGGSSKTRKKWKNGFLIAGLVLMTR